MVCVAGSEAKRALDFAPQNLPRELPQCNQVQSLLLSFSSFLPSSLLSSSRFGRRIIFAVSLVLSLPLGFGVALAVDYLMLLVMRMLFGAVLAGAFLSLYVARE